MLFLVLAFFALLIGFGRFKGFNTVVSLVLTCAAVFFVMIPAIIKGYNIYLVTFITAVFTIVMTLCIVIGVHPKSIAAAVGCTCGVGFAGLLTIAMQDALFITGLIDEESHAFTAYVEECDGQPAFRLPGTAVRLTQKDIRAVQLAKLSHVIRVALQVLGEKGEDPHV